MKSTMLQPLGAMLLAFGAGCDPPPKPPETPTIAHTLAPPAKCESLAENCLGKGDTRARIPKLGWTISPPTGWHYAQESDATVAEKNGGAGAVVVATTFDSPKSPWELKKVRIDAIERLSKRVGVQLAQKNVIDVHLRDVPEKLELEGYKLSIWEQEGAKRELAAGNVVVLVGGIDGRELLVLGFAPKADEADSRALVDAIQSLKKQPPETDSGSAGPGGKSP